MAKRTRKANRGPSKSKQVRTPSPVAIAQPAALLVEPLGTDSLAGAILASAHDELRPTVPEVRQAKSPEPATRVDALAETIIGYPIVTVPPLEPVRVELAPEPVAQVDSPVVSTASQPEEPQDEMRNSLDAFNAAFFEQPVNTDDDTRARLESFPPVADDLGEVKKVEAPSPAVLARRSRLRKVVGAIVALAAMVVVGGVCKNLVAGERPLSSLASNANAQVAVVDEVEQTAPAVAPLAAEPAVAPKPQPAAAEPPAPIAEAAKPVEAPVAAAVPAGVDPKAEALRLLNVGKLKDAVPMAKSAIAADPSDALPYLYLGTALQELGKQKEATEAYSDCVRNATKGRVWECKAMGGKK